MKDGKLIWIDAILKLEIAFRIQLIVIQQRITGSVDAVALKTIAHRRVKLNVAVNN